MIRSSLLVAAVMVSIITTHADLVERNTWQSQSLNDTDVGIGNEPIPSFANPTVNTDGAGWRVDIVNITDGNNAVELSGASSPSFGWYDGFGYVIMPFNFTATEGDVVFMRLWNSENPMVGDWRLDSAPVMLPDLVDPVVPGEVDVTFDFSHSTWVIPEPATVSLMGIFGFGIFCIRRKFRC